MEDKLYDLLKEQHGYSGNESLKKNPAILIDGKTYIIDAEKQTVTNVGDPNDVKKIGDLKPDVIKNVLKRLQEGKLSKDEIKNIIGAEIDSAFELLSEKEGLSTGDISPEDSRRLEEIEKELTNIAMRWVQGNQPAEEAKLPPKPKVGDGVERVDMSKMFGRVTKIVDDDNVEVDWGEDGKSIEKIVDLALVKRMNETGEMGMHDIQPGGDDYEWAKAIENDVKKLESLTKGKVKFKEMRPFDKYQGPYAYTNIGQIWDAQIEGERVLSIPSKVWMGSVEQLAAAFNGDKNAVKVVTKQSQEGLPPIDMPPAEETDKVKKLKNAINVFLNDEKISAWLKANDPKALEQAKDAVKEKKIKESKFKVGDKVLFTYNDVAAFDEDEKQAAKIRTLSGKTGVVTQVAPGEDDTYAIDVGDWKGLIVTEDELKSVNEEYEPFMSKDTRIPHPEGAEEALNKLIQGKSPEDKKIMVDAFNRGWNPIGADGMDAKSFMEGYKAARRELGKSESRLMEEISDDEHNDLVAFVKFGLDNNKSADWILSNLIHDLIGLQRRDVGFSPRTHGYAGKPKIKKPSAEKLGPDGRWHVNGSTGAEESRINEDKIVVDDVKEVELMDWNQLTDDEKLEFDHVKDGEGDFFRYGDAIWRVQDFEKIPESSELAKQGWAGVIPTTVWDGCIIKLPDVDNNVITVGYFYQKSSVDEKVGDLKFYINDKTGLLVIDREGQDAIELTREESFKLRDALQELMMQIASKKDFESKIKEGKVSISDEFYELANIIARAHFEAGQSSQRLRMSFPNWSGNAEIVARLNDLKEIKKLLDTAEQLARDVAAAADDSSESKLNERNMSYVRFENTYRDLGDCADHINDTDLSDSEFKYRNQLVELCQEIVNDADPELQSGDEEDEENPDESKVNEIGQNMTDYTGDLYDIVTRGKTDKGEGMYSVGRPAYAFWNGFANALEKSGYNRDQIFVILGSTYIRHYFDSIDDDVEKSGFKYGKLFVKDMKTSLDAMLKGEGML